ncbi:MAG: ABC transporter substrate-binding protein, partial [Desulfatitalea sp.]|nr:ABC transporter substrate-binding protein [Desulfatitalea sp.]NNJ99593.1 ABC transporter substrate-binding protein [Desulfatitalea sp.]
MALAIILCHPIVLPAAQPNPTITDALGRVVRLPDRTERIACLYAFSGHVVAMLGKADQIVAVSNGLKRDILFCKMFPGVTRATVPKRQGAINIEALIGARPDVVFVQSQTGQDPATADRLDALGLTWIAIDFHTMAQQRNAILMIGKAIGALRKAKSYNAYYTNCIERVSRMVAMIPLENRPKVFHATVEPNRTSPRQSLPSDWLAQSGLNNVITMDPDRLAGGNKQVGMEQILLWNPGVILANEPGVANFIMRDSQWSAVRAVRCGRVYQMP